ncbi:NosL family protein [Desulfopila sp. IMCC35006]|nr:NosL family protein [Desulfopila sp. IMCC35006]
MRYIMKNSLILITVLFFVATAGVSNSAGLQAGESVNKESRCPVCGMFVAKYPQWLTQITMSDGSTEIFDGVKDLMAYYFAPQQFGAAAGNTVDEVFVKDYYSQKWIDGKKAIFVQGSDVYGPMGHELIPFDSQAGAESFFKDHHGKKIYSFAEITPDVIESLRKGHTMKGHKMKEHSMSGHTMQDTPMPKTN